MRTIADGRHLAHRVPVRPARWRPLCGVLFVVLFVTAGCAGQKQLESTPSFSGQNALQHTLAVVELGPRPPGTPAHQKTQEYIIEYLKSLGLSPEVDAFSVATPVGQRELKNILVRVPGRTGKAVLIGGHYDTKLERGFRFIGANDAGSSTGVLLELARAFKTTPQRQLGVWLAFFDGEEPLGGDWTDTDSIYGSRQMAARMRQSGEYRQLVAMLNVDMVGDRDLKFTRDFNSTGWLIEMASDVAAKLGHADIFTDDGTPIGDDHVPFSKIGLPVLDLIDFNYGPPNTSCPPGSPCSYWHTAQDTPDKISARSMELTGKIVLGMVDALGRRQ